MRIAFAVPQKSDPNAEGIMVIDGAYEWAEILALAKEKEVSPPSRKWYMYVRALCSNPAFITEIQSARKKCGLKENLLVDAERFERFKRSSWMEVASGKFSSEHDEKLRREARRIKDVFSLPGISVPSLELLINSGCFKASPKATEIRFEKQNDEIHIIISGPIARHKIKKSIDENVVPLTRLLNSIKNELPNINISDRDFEIIRLRDEKKLSFHKIATEIANKYSPGDLESKVNDDSVRIAYDRAAKKISVLFEKNKHKK
jgi:predicted DNA-binding protein (UPF0251 family)